MADPVKFIVNGRWVDGQGKDYGEAKAEESKAQEAQTQQPVTPPPPMLTLLADEFPGKQVLAGAGYTTREGLLALTDEQLRAVKGVGPATFDQIKTALAG